MSLSTLLHKAGCRYGTRHRELILSSKKISCRYKFLYCDSCESVLCITTFLLWIYCSHNVFISCSPFSFCIEDLLVMILTDSCTCFSCDSVVGSWAWIWSWGVSTWSPSKCWCGRWCFSENVFLDCWVSMLWAFTSSPNNTALFIKASTSGKFSFHVDYIFYFICILRY